MVDDSDNLSGIGNISLTGTVDGRDVAADGTKLDGIESAADVTDATNVAAAGAVMDSDISEGEGLLRKTGAGAYEAIKTNLSASAAPGATDDSAAGYAVGSLWIDTTADSPYVCVDATASSAVWDQLDASGSGDVTGPASAADNAIATYNGTGGKTIQDNHSGAVTISDAGALTLTQRILNANGSAAAPSYSFSSAGAFGLRYSSSELFVMTGSSVGVAFNANNVYPSGHSNKTLDLGLDGARFERIFCGGFVPSCDVYTTSQTLNSKHCFVRFNGSSLTATLPTTPPDGTSLWLRNINATSLTITPGGSDTCDVASLAQNEVCLIVYDAGTTNWINFSTNI